MKALFEKIRRALRTAWEFLLTLRVLRLGAPTTEQPAPERRAEPARPIEVVEFDEDEDEDDIDGDGPAPLRISAPTPTVAAS